MRGIYHSSTAIEAFLERYPVPQVPKGTNIYLKGLGTVVFTQLLEEGPGRLPTVYEFQAAYLPQQTREMQQQRGVRHRMAGIYRGLIRDYHAGALCIEHPDVTHVFWSADLDANYGIDYVVCVQRRYAAVHVGTWDPHRWGLVKAQRKADVSHVLDYHINLVVQPNAHVKGEVFLCQTRDVQSLVAEVAEHGATRPAEMRVWTNLGLQEVASMTELGSLADAKQQDLDL